MLVINYFHFLLNDPLSRPAKREHETHSFLNLGSVPIAMYFFTIHVTVFI